jgi:spore maturation protein CgeB
MAINTVEFKQMKYSMIKISNFKIIIITTSITTSHWTALKEFFPKISKIKMKDSSRELMLFQSKCKLKIINRILILLMSPS